MTTAAFFVTITTTTSTTTSSTTTTADFNTSESTATYASTTESGKFHLLKLLHGLTDSQESYELNQTNRGIRKYYLIILAAVGIPSNILALVTILSMHALSPATLFVVLLAILDGSALTVKLIGNQMAEDGMNNNIVFCKFLDPLSIFFSMAASWMLVLICLERFISIKYPLQKAYLFTQRRSFIMASILIGSLFIFIMTTLGITRVPGTDRCKTKERYKDFHNNIWLYLNVALHLFIPFLLILVLTVSIIYGLHRASQHRLFLVRKSIDANVEMSAMEDARQETPRASKISRSTSTKTTSPTASSSNNQKILTDAARVERTITLMLITAGVIFLVLSLPMALFYLIHGFGGPQGKTTEADRWLLYKQIAYVLIDSSHAINFFLYFFTAKRFRDQLVRLFCCWGCKTWSRQRGLSTRANRSVTEHSNRPVSFQTASSCLSSAIDSD
ncbi:thyrotropin-releasing hormone receptor [Elysia marginata]|uniref:Thyrotropin-releasing hormone receptor n=1 Tax=Elysia marginata TaxID=1093978 RepID=A0AAV4G2T5_9GAST|nr:thyrotropin-releasing hormone receptor [Elysia marginata]